MSQQVELEKTRITSALTSQFSQELQKERAGRERVSADLRALLAFEITAKHRFEEDLDKVEFESAESQKQLCKLQNAFNSHVCDPLDARTAATQSRKLAEAMLEQIKPAIREVNHIHAQVAGLETSHSALQRQYDEASLSSEAMRYQLAISRTAWQDAENERIEAEKRSAEVKLSHKQYLEEKDVMESLRASLKESLEDALLFETLYQRSQQQLLKLQEERSRVRDNAMQLYSNRDYTQAKPIIEQLLEMDPADEEALHCYKIILEEETEKTQHQQRVLQQASQYTVQKYWNLPREARARTAASKMLNISGERACKTSQQQVCKVGKSSIAFSALRLTTTRLQPLVITATLASSESVSAHQLMKHQSHNREPHTSVARWR